MDNIVLNGQGGQATPLIKSQLLFQLSYRDKVGRLHFFRGGMSRKASGLVDYGMFQTVPGAISGGRSELMEKFR